ncbi:MAG: methyltransferase domain-containing protein [Planctomycetes bacterium]|nr:methyltransferase domain-containing protein [Planctomycetota bacterium]
MLSLKEDVKLHWEKEVCGSRYGRQDFNESVDLETMACERYRLEPYISDFADFEAAKNKKILEIGTGGGVDFSCWLKAGAQATGIDLTEAAIELTKQRLDQQGFAEYAYRLTVGDAESLEFENESFDIVYSYGVLHHTPDTERAFGEACRVLKKGGVFKAMVYHVPSVTGWILWLRYCLFTGRFFKSPRWAIYRHLESQGTKSYTIPEMRLLLEKKGFVNVKLYTKLGFGDLLLNKPSKKYQSRFYSLIWKFYPRWLVKLFGDKYGLFLFVEANK